MNAIYGVKKMGYVESPPEGFGPKGSLSAANSYANTIDGDVYVSRDDGRTWSKHTPDNHRTR